MYKSCIDKIKIERTFKLNDLKSVWLSGIFMSIVASLFFVSDNSFLIAFGFIFMFIFIIIFGVGIIVDVLSIRFDDEYILVKKLFREEKYHYNQISSIEVDSVMLKFYDEVRIYIKPYGREIKLWTYQPLELFFQANYAYRQYFDKTTMTYMDIFENLNKHEREAVKLICDTRHRYKKMK